jgi:sugar transferase (PEP-CTERM/EpsH1 system associated)
MIHEASVALQERPTTAAIPERPQGAGLETVAPVARESRRVRVCHVSWSLCTGGLERLLVDFARFHDPLRFELHFIAMRAVGQPAEEIRRAGCPVHVIPDQRGGRIREIRQLAHLFREVRPDIVHTHNSYPHFYGTFAARWAGVPAVIHTRHGRRIGTTRNARWQFWLAAQFADRIVAVSDDAAQLCRQHECLGPRKVQRIWNGINLDRFRYHGPVSEPVAISVARLSPEKDFPTLLKATSLAARLVPNFRLLLVGDGPERPMLEELARDLKIADRVQFLGERNDVPDLLAQAGFFVSASLTEGVSLTLLEAMAVGLPVLATAVGGNPEVVADGITGHLVPSADPDALAAGIVRLCRDQQRWDELGRQGRRRVEECFNIRHMLRDYETLYGQVLADKGVRR